MPNNSAAPPLARFVKDFIVLRSSALSYINYARGEEFDESIIWVGLEYLFEILLLQFKIEEAFMCECHYSAVDNHTSDHNALIERLAGLLYDQTSSMEVIKSFLEIVGLWVSDHWQGRDRALWMYLRRINEQRLLTGPVSLHNSIMPRLSRLLETGRL